MENRLLHHVIFKLPFSNFVDCMGDL